MKENVSVLGCSLGLYFSRGFLPDPEIGSKRTLLS